MKSTLKIIGWMLLGIFLFAVLLIGGFAFYIYKSVKSNVFEYTCAQYSKDINTMFDDKPETIENKMKPVAVMSTLMGYTLIRNNGQMPENLFQNKAQVIRYNDELISICDKNPTLIPFKLYRDIKDKKVPLAVTQQVNELLAGVTVTSHPQATKFIEIMAKGIADREALARSISETQVNAISPTSVASPTVSPTVQP